MVASHNVSHASDTGPRFRFLRQGSGFLYSRIDSTKETIA